MSAQASHNPQHVDSCVPRVCQSTGHAFVPRFYTEPLLLPGSKLQGTAGGEGITERHLNSCKILLLVHSNQRSNNSIAPPLPLSPKNPKFRCSWINVFPAPQTEGTAWLCCLGCILAILHSRAAVQFLPRSCASPRARSCYWWPPGEGWAGRELTAQGMGASHPGTTCFPYPLTKWHFLVAHSVLSSLNHIVRRKM